MKDLISVIVPVYNVEQYLNKCVESILNQTYTNIEVIIVDDGSTDSCGEMCDSYRKRDDRVCVIHKKNGGLSEARNVGIDVARGEYLVFVDSDDYVATNMLEDMYKVINSDGTKISVCGYTDVDDKDNELDIAHSFAKQSVVTEREFWQLYYDGGSMYCAVAWNKMYARKLFDDIRYDVGKINEDEFILHKLISNCDKISLISDKYYYYRHRASSIMNRPYSLNRLDVADAFLQREKYFYDKNWYDLSCETLLGIVGIVQKGYTALDRRDDKVRAKLKEIHHGYRNAYVRVLKKKTRVQFVFWGGLYFIGIGLHNCVYMLGNVIKMKNKI